MNAENLIAACRQSGVQIHLENGTIKLKGAEPALSAVAARLRPHKAGLMEYLSASADLDVWGPYMPYCVPVPLELICELGHLIEKFCRQWKCDDEATRRIIDAAKKQPASTVRSDVAWFRCVVDTPPSQ